jgi:phenylpropionate dioxygenase-like ring-hydroxylating dioxygenase large terminal subunit
VVNPSSEALAAAHESIRPDFIPADRYVGPNVTALELERLWPKIWHIVCRQEEVDAVGDYVTYDIGTESIIVVRTDEARVKALYNVCQHRGRRLIEDAGGKTRGFYCRFHGWSYRLDGSIAQVYRKEEWKECPGFRDEHLGLKELRIEAWGGWWWVNMESSAPPLLEWLGPDLVQTFEPFDFPKLRRAWHEVLIAPVNWKVVVEAFSEGYHSGATHNHWIDYNLMRSPTSVHGRHAKFSTDFGGLPKAKREDGQWGATLSLQEMIYLQIKELHDTLFALAPDPMLRAARRLYDENDATLDPLQILDRLWSLHREELTSTGAEWPPNLTQQNVLTAGTGWHLFPNTIFLPAVDGVLWYRVRPFGSDPHRCIFDIWSLQRYAAGSQPQIKTHVSDGFEAFRGRNAFLEQDFENMLAVDRGMASRGWAGARTNPGEEGTINHFHRMLDEYLAEPPSSR